MNEIINNLCDMMKDDPALACAIMDILFNKGFLLLFVPPEAHCKK